MTWLVGKNNILGRSVVVHDLKDDLGKGGDEESLKTGNAGAGGLPKLRRLDFEENELSIEGIEAIAEALAEAIDNCALPRFKALWVPEEHENNPRLLAFTVSRNVCVNADPASDDEESSGDEVESDE